MEKDKFVLVLGGARSGKSEFAEQLVSEAPGPITYVATAAVGDEEMRQRIDIHRQRRPATWRTVEETHWLPEVLDRYGREPGIILIDCMTVWTTNLLLDESLPHEGASDMEKEQFILQQAKFLAQQAVACTSKVVVVANEVGLGVVPPYPLGRLFRDVAGRVNRCLAEKADQVYFVVAGLAVDVKAMAVNKG